MGNLFGNAVSKNDKAVLQLKIQRDKLKQYQKKIINVQQEEIKIAKKHLANGVNQLIF
jgi:charged multivesicular body protein 6